METDGIVHDKTIIHKMELNRKELKLHDDLEDFFDEGLLHF